VTKFGTLCPVSKVQGDELRHAVPKFVKFETGVQRGNFFTSPALDCHDDIEDDDRELDGCPYLKSFLSKGHI
jgi:hypothetical protein